MPNGVEKKARLRGRLRIVLAACAILVLVFVVPPFISVSHYKSQITQIVSRSLGRPVRLSSVEVRVLPWPGFVLSDLNVAEDPAYGAEPVLHANKVIASIRLLSLWRGHPEIGKISVDEASLNLVRAAPGHWNLDPLFRTAAAQTGAAAGAGHAQRLPELVATSSRINFKDGVEKLPFSLVDSDLSVWQEKPGVWRIRLRGHPARTDVSLHQEETGVVRMEASVSAAPALSQMPIKLDLGWRQAQLGQLARLITGSDPGWRGDLTGDLHLEGSPDAAQIRMRLRAEGVHRAEFVPASAFDFDAKCAFAYHYTQRSLENLSCDSPLGDGRIHLAGDKLGSGAPTHLSLELDRIPVDAGLDALRTVRSSLAPDLEAKGAISGKLVYGADAAAGAEPPKQAKPARRAKRPAAPPPALLSGSLTVTDFALSGGGLSQPIQAPKIVLAPVAAPEGSPQALAATVSVPVGGSIPLTFNVRLSLTGYRVAARGQAGIARARELAHAAGIPETAALAALAGDPVSVDLAAEGPWMPAEEVSLIHVSPPAAAHDAISAARTAQSGAAAPPATDVLTGTVTVHNANWKADYLVNRVVLDEATLHLDGSGLRWDPVVFSYGAVKGTAVLIAPSNCAPQPEPQSCPVQFQMRFGDLDAASFQIALLGAREKGTLLSTLIERFHPSASTPWPRLEGAVSADSLVLDPVTLRKVSATLKVLPSGVEISSLDAGLYGGKLHLTGTLDRPATDHEKPAYAFDGSFQKLNAASLGALLGLRWAGSPVSGNGKIELSGYSGADLAASAKGSLHFECRRGAMGNHPAASTKAGPVPYALGRFDRFTADAAIANGTILLGQNQIVSGARKHSIQAKITLSNSPKVTFAEPKEARASRH